MFPNLYEIRDLIQRVDTQDNYQLPILCRLPIGPRIS